MTLTVKFEGAKYFSITFVVDVKIRLNEKKLQHFYQYF